MNSGDTAFMLMATALVMFMTPGLALFYAGLVRTKNVLGTAMQSFVALGLISLLWVTVGFSLAFGPDHAGIIGGLAWAGLRGVGLTPGTYASTIPALLFCAFQLMFAIITPALITGAFAERMKFSAYVLFALLWSLLVYVPLAHWIWGGGWLAKLGVLDFAGGLVIHLSAGAAALVTAIMLGKRKGYGRATFHPHNLPMALLGAGILWFGWFGFNAGSAFAANGVAVAAFFNTQIAAGAAVLSWLAAEWFAHRHATTLGAISGAVAGLATITPAAGYVAPGAAVLIGLAAGVICYLAVLAKNKLGYDDALDVVGVHGVGGLLGALAVGFFATLAVNQAGANGLFFGSAHLLGVQALAALVVIVYSVIVTAGILKVVNWLVGLRMNDQEELQGLDLSQHSETAYY